MARWTIAVATLVMFGTSNLMAHPGHGIEALQPTLLHWIEPEHIAITLTALAALIVMGVRKHRRTKRQDS